MLTAAELKLVNKSIQILFDSQGRGVTITRVRPQIRRSRVLLARAGAVPREAVVRAGAGDGLPEEQFRGKEVKPPWKIKIRSAKFEDFKLEVDTEMQIGELKGMIAS